MEHFLQLIHKAKGAIGDLEHYKNIHLVLGNESCDLDSTVSALAIAYLIYSEDLKNHYLVIPIMNVEAKYFPLRTETCCLLKECGIDPDSLVYKDEIIYADILKNSHVQTTIVDHHVLSESDKILEQSVVQIFDHRPINSEEICQNEGLRKTIKTVGSCCTLITNELFNSKLPILFKELCHLLYATIIYDTIGLDKSSGKTFNEDIIAAERLEQILKPKQTRKELFNAVWEIHSDISNLGTKWLLYRDLKVVQGIPIPGLPLLVEEYLQRKDAVSAIKSFAEEFSCRNVLLIGIDASAEVKRDLAIYFTNERFKDALIEALNNSKETSGSDLLLSEIPIKNKHIVCFRQGNIKLTRKFILPLVNETARRFFKNG